MDPSVREFDVPLPDGRTLHAYERLPPGPVRATVYWHGGTPNLGAPPAPLFADGDQLGVRWLGHDRPGYGGSTLTAPGRAIADIAADTRALSDAVDAGPLVTFGHSGGGPHALACAALLTDRVHAVASISAPAPYAPSDFDYFAGMGDPGPLRTAVEGRDARVAYDRAAPETPPPFIPADWEALQGDWSWVMSVVGPALEGDGPEAMFDDDVALTADWGFAPAAITIPALLVHGADDQLVPASHGRRLAELLPGAELRIIESAGHVSVLSEAAAALGWLVDRA